MKFVGAARKGGPGLGSKWCYRSRLTIIDRAIRVSKGEREGKSSRNFES